MLPYIHPTMLYRFKGPKFKLESKYTTIGPRVRRFSSAAGNPLFNNLLPSTLYPLGIRSIHNGSSPIMPVKSYDNADILKK